MDWDEPLRSFDLDQDLTFRDEIDTLVNQQVPAIEDGEPLFDVK